MSKLSFGTQGQLTFSSEEQFYEALGCFANRESFSITFEENSLTNSYADAYRIKKKTPKKLMSPIENALRNGNRINCNEYVQYIMSNHGFYRDSMKHILCDPHNVLTTVPYDYQRYFIKGYNECSSLTDPTLVPTQYTKKVKKSYQRKNTDRSLSSKKNDYLEQQKKNAELGYKGEKLVYDREYDKLKKAVEDGLIDSVDKYLEWVSLNDDSKGYDIKSYSLEERKTIYLEVKTTSGSKSSSFFISQNEVNFSKTHSDEYVLMRLFNFKDNEDVPFFEVKGDITKSDILDLNTNTYVAVMK